MGFYDSKGKRWLAFALAVCLVGTGGVCTGLRLQREELGMTMGLLAAKATFPAGHFTEEFPPAPDPPDPETPEPAPEPESKEEPSAAVPAAASPAVKPFQSRLPTSEERKAYDEAHEGEEKYPVREFTATQGDCAVEGVQVKYSASVDVDLKEELSSPLGFKVENTDQPQVLIYHTHTCESFLLHDTGYYYESFYPRTTDQTQNVCAVGEEIVSRLSDEGIVALHDTTVHDDPSYSGAYDRSEATVRSYLERYPSIKVVIDIHRDGLGSDSERSKPVCMAGGKKAAQFMIMAGYNDEDLEVFENWEYNLRFALRLQKEAVREYPDIARPLYFGNFMYNMHINTGSLLIEVGADSNTLEEVRYTGYLLGGILANVLKEKQ